MGKTAYPLKIAITDARLLDEPVIADLIEKKNTIVLVPNEIFGGEEPDLILGPNCTRWYPSMKGALIESIVKTVRTKKYPKNVKLESTEGEVG